MTEVRQMGAALPAAGADAVAAVEVRDVRYAYPGTAREVLAGVSLRVPRGTCLALMGSNGCGKSTLLDCVLGVNRPDAGSVLVDGDEVAALRPRDMARRVSYVPQVHERTFPYTVLHIVTMGCAARTGGVGGPHSEEAEIARSALRRCGIEHLADRPYVGLSGGEMQMVMLARALAQDCPVVVMDEPTAHLDVRNQLLFLEMVASLVRDEGATVLMATHDPNQAFHLERAGVPCEVALLHQGRLGACGSPAEVIERCAEQVFEVEACLLRGTAGDECVAQWVPLRTTACGRVSDDEGGEHGGQR